ncbi:MAG TPA: tetratricopeptide repeat protein, partial [Verrucomicrobiae bacterium]|nr:tetratricopeptide repeat protein [Verrucomicrobiae bacterium]
MSRPRLIALLLALGTLLVYLPVTRHQFVNYDDGGYVTENPTVKAGLTWHGIKWAFTTWVVGNWHPVTMLSHMLDCQLFGLNSGLQHYENALFHAANTVLLFWLLLRLTQRRPEKDLSPTSSALWPAAFVAALFAWHPLHVESVAWIAERKDVLSTFFELLALMCYACCVTSDRQSSILHSPSYWFALVFFLLGLMSKPMLVTMPFVMVLLDFWPLGRFNRLGACGPSPHPDPLPSHQYGSGEETAGGPEQVHGSLSVSSGNSTGKIFQAKTLLRLIVEKWPFFLLTVIFCGITFWSQHGTGAVNTAKDFPLIPRIENALISYGRYLLKMIWPVNLAVIYPLFKLHGAMTVLAVAMAIALLAVSWLAWKEQARFPYLLTGWFWYLGTLVPVIGLVHVGGASMADRYSYFPLVGIFIIIAFGARDLINRLHIGATVPAAAAMLVLAACVGLTERQLTYWQNSITLFEHAIAITRDNDIAHSNLGLALEKAGEPGKALAQFKEALRISPDSAAMHNNIA